MLSARPEQKVRRFRRPNAMGSPGRRFCANWPAEIRAEGRTLNGRVVDISSGGAQLELKEFPCDSAQFWLAIEHSEPIRAEIAWRKRNQAGIRFVEEQAWVLQLYERRFNPAAWLEKG